MDCFMVLDGPFLDVVLSTEAQSQVPILATPSNSFRMAFRASGRAMTSARGSWRVTAAGNTSSAGSSGGHSGTMSSSRGSQACPLDDARSPAGVGGSAAGVGGATDGVGGTPLRSP